jgi:small subunit ribosomal protein S20
VAHSLSAKKRNRQNLKLRGRNRWRKDQLKDTLRTFEQKLAEGDKDGAAAELKVVYKRLDQTAAKGTIHKNSAARKKSRLARRLAKATAKA